MDKEDQAEAKAGKQPSPAEEKAEAKGKKVKKPTNKNYSPSAIVEAKGQETKGQ